jgi:hypothetical protein
MLPLHGQHQTILMFLSLNDVNFGLPVILAGDLGVCLVLRSDNQTLLAALADLIFFSISVWWVEEDLNLRPHAYQACALTT